ncbi:MAG: FAD binding domain-containing protein [Thermoprotei archaeon]
MPFKIASLEYYYSPKTVGETCSLLLSNRDFIPVAGGSAIYIFSAKGLLQEVKGFVSLEYLPLNDIRDSGQYIELGATVTHQQVLESTIVKPGILTEALLTIPKEVRSVGTVGGQLCTCFPNFDLNVALLALDAEVVISGVDGERSMGVAEFFRGVFDPNLRLGEIVTGVRIPKTKGLLSGYTKSSLTAHGFSIVSVGVAFELNDGFFEKVRVAAGGTLNTPPVRLKSVEEALKGGPVTRDLVASASERALVDGGLSVASDFKSSSDYKKHLVSVLTRRTILRLVGL